MSLNVYKSGTLVQSTATYRNTAGAIADPDTVTLKYRKGAAATVTVVYPAAGITKDATGVYHATFDTSGWAGPDNLLYVTEWIGAGAVVAINDDSWLVEPPAL